MSALRLRGWCLGFEEGEMGKGRDELGYIVGSDIIRVESGKDDANGENVVVLV